MVHVAPPLAARMRRWNIPPLPAGGECNGLLHCPSGGRVAAAGRVATLYNCERTIGGGDYFPPDGRLHDATHTARVAAFYRPGPRCRGGPRCGDVT
jgi:hypothetical protein